MLANVTTAAAGCSWFDTVCNVENVVDTAVDVGTKFLPTPVVGAVKALEFAADPPGWVLQQFQDGIKFLASVLIPWVLDALHPDFTATWFRDAYAVSFGVAMLVMAILVLVATVQRRRGDSSGQSLIDSLAKALPMFLVGSIYGPVLGFLITKLTTGLSDSLAQWGVNSTTTDFYSTWGNRFAEFDFVGTAIGWPIGIIILASMLGTLVGVVLMLCIQLAMMYLIGVLIPLGLVWLINEKTRSFGNKVPLVFLAVAFSHVLLFLLLGTVYKAVAGLTGEWITTATEPADAAKNLVNMVLIIILLAMAVFSPAALWRLGRSANPLGGAGTTREGGVNPPSKDGPQPSPDSVKTASSGPAPQGGAVPASGPAVPAGATGNAAGASAGGSTAAGGSVAAGGTTAAAGGTAAAAGGTAAGGTVAAAGGTAAAGAAVSSTGVGAAIGIPMMLAAGAKTVASGFHAAQAAADQVGEAGDERD